MVQGPVDGALFQGRGREDVPGWCTEGGLRNRVNLVMSAFLFALASRKFRAEFVAKFSNLAYLCFKNFLIGLNLWNFTCHFFDPDL